MNTRIGEFIARCGKAVVLLTNSVQVEGKGQASSSGRMVISFLALSVTVWHLQAAPFHLLYAPFVLVCFFVVSGFYMAMVLTQKYDR